MEKYRVRIITIVKLLGKHNLVFHGTNEKLHQNSNGKFLGLIKMLDSFYPIVQEHVRCITNNKLVFITLVTTSKMSLSSCLLVQLKMKLLRK